MQRTGRPVLVGTASVAESEELAAALRQRRVKCRVLNARHDAREALIVSRAGMAGAVTISTNMAGSRHRHRAGRRRPRGAREGGGARRPVRDRHEPPREPARRRPTARPRRPPGRPWQLALLREPRGRPRHALRRARPDPRRPSAVEHSDGPVQDPAVRQAINRAQRVIEGAELRDPPDALAVLVDGRAAAPDDVRAARGPAARRRAACRCAPRRRPSTTRSLPAPSAPTRCARPRGR